ncbi:FmdE family protein [Trichloromonas sp.]|uniref:FmdE family protein n=1 Tax=Trichloromonas sp. TaxID=3069249 RepID=UPI003D815776
MPVPRALFDEIYARHGHRCPMSTLGGRIGYAAAAQVAAGERLAIYYANTCALDGIRVTTGIGSPRVIEQGRHALVLVGRADGRGVQVSLRPAALDIAWEYRRVSEALDRDRAGLDEAALAMRQAELAQVLDGVLQRLWTLPDEELLEIVPAELDPNDFLER